MKGIFYTELVDQSKRSYKFKIDGINVWIPKNIMEDWSTVNRQFYIPLEFYNKNLKK